MPDTKCSFLGILTSNLKRGQFAKVFSRIGYRVLLMLLVIVVTMVAMPPLPVSAWKPNQHVGMGRIVLEDLIADNKVNIGGVDYAVNSLALQAIKSFPEYYLMGTIGPDAYPDIYFVRALYIPILSESQATVSRGQTSGSCFC